MALSFCSNWGGVCDHLNPEMSNYQQIQADLAKDLLGFNDNYVTPNTVIDPFFDHDNSFYIEENNNFLLQSPFSDPPLYLSPEIFPADEPECYQYPKRSKTYDDYYPSSDFSFNFFDGSVGATCLPPEFLAEFMIMPTECQVPVVFSSGVEGPKKANGVCLSAQSVAARQRRKKISEKTQELGKLIPGGTKMNTAEMFQAAFKYVKYLQAQVRILEEFATKIPEAKELIHLREFQALLNSLTIQQKLYEEEKCIVPKQVVEYLVKDEELQSEPSISIDLSSLLKAMG